MRTESTLTGFWVLLMEGWVFQGLLRGFQCRSVIQAITAPIITLITICITATN